MERGDEGSGDLGQALRDAEGEVARLIAATARELRDRVQRKDLGSTNATAIQALAQLVGAFYGEDGVAGLSDEYDDDGKPRELTPDDIRAMRDYVEANRAESSSFDIVMEGETPGDDPECAAAIVRPWADAGATWWIEALWNEPRDAAGLNAVRRRAAQGPPRLDR